MTKRFGRWLKRWFGPESLGAEGWPRPNAVTRYKFETEGGHRFLVWWNEDAEFVGPGWLVTSPVSIARWLFENPNAVAA